MAHPKQSTDYQGKTALRQLIADEVPLGPDDWVYLPFCGEGDCYKPFADIWPQERVLAVDKDAELLNTFHSRWPRATVVCDDVDSVNLGALGGAVRIADFDAYSNPGPTIKHFFAHGRIAFGTIGLLTTSGLPSSCQKQARPWRWRKGRMSKDRHKKRSQQQISHWGDEEACWLRSFGQVEGVQVRASKMTKSFTHYGAYTCQIQQTPLPDQVVPSAARSVMVVDEEIQGTPPNMPAVVDKLSTEARRGKVLRWTIMGLRISTIAARLQVDETTVRRDQKALKQDLKHLDTTHLWETHYLRYLEFLGIAFSRYEAGDREEGEFAARLMKRLDALANLGPQPSHSPAVQVGIVQNIGEKSVRVQEVLKLLKGGLEDG